MLSFEDNEEEAEKFEVNEVDREYDSNRYSSNKPGVFQDDEDEPEGGSIMQRMEQQERSRALKNRYGGFGIVSKPRRKPEVMGVTGVDYDSPHEDEDGDYSGRYAGKREDDEDIERDESLTLDELDGWMSRVNQRPEDHDQDIGPAMDDHDDEFEAIIEHYQARHDLPREDSFGAVLR